MIVNYSLPRILVQQGDGCSSYAVSGLVEWLFANVQKIAKQVDVAKFYQECTPKGQGQTMSWVTQYAENVGVPLMDGTRYKIKSQRYIPQWAVAESGLKVSPMVFTIKIPLGQSLSQQVAKPPNLFNQITKTHSMVLCGFDSVKKEFRIASSEGTGWGNNGYAVLNYSLFNDNNVLDLYEINL